MSQTLRKAIYYYSMREAGSTGPEGRNNLAQRFSAGKAHMSWPSPGGTTQMSHAYCSNRIHLIFSTKDRQKLLMEGLQPKLWAYMAGIAHNQGFEAMMIGGVEDHVHALLILPPSLPLSKAVQFLKGSSSKWINDAGSGGTHFAWQEGYGAFSVSASQTSDVVRYIRDQRSHHAKVSFEDEFLAFLKKYGVTYEPRYVWG
jgi:putative transposase